jgi:hypothetical protein
MSIMYVRWVSVFDTTPHTKPHERFIRTLRFHEGVVCKTVALMQETCTRPDLICQI